MARQTVAIPHAAKFTESEREKGNKMKRMLRTLILIPLFAVKFLSAQALIIPQAPDGQNWRFTLVVTNTTTAAATASITFFQNIDATGDTTPWSPPLDANVADLEVPAGSSVFVHSSGTAATLTEGWAQVTSSPPGALQAYIIYTYSPQGKPSSDGTAQAMSPATRFLVAYDQTGSLGTELAVANPNPSPVSISVNFSNPGVPTGSLNLPANGWMAFGMLTPFPATAGQSGLAEFYSTDTFAIIALRSNLNPVTGVFSFTSAPTYNETGPPIISSAGAQNTISLTIQGNQGPWDPSLNPSFDYGYHDNAKPAVVSAASNIPFKPGEAIKLAYVSGLVNVFPEGGFPYTNANGNPKFTTNNITIPPCGKYPSYYMNPSTYPINAAELVGTFANNGVIVGIPFALGNGPTTLIIPSGANQLLLGVDDNCYYDNVGSWNLSVSY
ncbi:MAG TPA: hypothetical protein VK335_04630 [Bryobacteraceae bacterium]|nr:hypothetical protein [Bryobacteraceae bacterium]